MDSLNQIAVVIAVQSTPSMITLVRSGKKGFEAENEGITLLAINVLVTPGMDRVDRKIGPNGFMYSANNVISSVCLVNIARCVISIAMV